MKNLMNSLIALAGLAIMAVAAPILLPFTGLGASGLGGNAPVSQTQNVLVVNSGQQPLPVTGSATVTGTVQAQQAGTWNVGINGTPTVGIDSTNNTVKIDGTSLVRVRDIDNPARNAFVFNDSGTMASNIQFATFAVSVPANKLLVVEQLSVWSELTPVADQKLSVVIAGHLGGVNTEYSVIGQNSGSSPNGAFDIYVANSQMRFYSDSSNPVLIGVHRNNATGIANSVLVFLSGYLIDVP